MPNLFRRHRVKEILRILRYFLLEIIYDTQLSNVIRNTATLKVSNRNLSKAPANRHPKFHMHYYRWGQAKDVTGPDIIQKTLERLTAQPPPNKTKNKSLLFRLTRTLWIRHPPFEALRRINEHLAGDLGMKVERIAVIRQLNVLCVLAIAMIASCTSVQANILVLKVDSPTVDVLSLGGSLFVADSAPQSAPLSTSEFVANLTPVSQINRSGGKYWLHVRIKNDTNISDWVFDPHNSVIDRIEGFI